ncbi:MAG: acyl-CoA dehydrogenase, partial [Deltaproteobacteria bacterium]|nr:acyl-CoA dehydrogenase [Deltaproteobacteria bacterium]
EEQAFHDGPLERLCDVLDDWKSWQDKEIPREAWDIMKKDKFFGMIIPKEYGGLGFSALANSSVVMKVATRSCAACVTVMVPNSLGPAELLTHYGTPEQKKNLLPKLASGEHIPCFGLTEPTAGSDAGGMKATGVLFKGDDGKLYIRLNWEKRWITLASIATILGIAFKLQDPDNLLGKGPNVGITCALVPSTTKGVTLGRRHDPLGVPFHNCPLWGKDVVVSAEECIVGGIKGAGRGWQMLMESLGAGRGISLPAQSVGGAKFVTRVCSNHATIRKQFGMSIGKFEGVEEPLARIAGWNYMMEANRLFTLGALDKGIKPPVITAIAKYCQTELARKIVNDGMDICGGSGISRGPRNLLAHMYIGTPIGITVEGANILTRTLMIFGQGALRAHPFAYPEVKAAGENNLKAFDKAFWGHVGHVVRNLTRSCLLSITRGRLALSPVAGPTAKYYRRLAWASASFAILADLAMGTLGGSLKVKQKITGRFADILGGMYFGLATLRRFEAEGRRKEDLPFVHFGMSYVFSEIQNAFDGIFSNMGGIFRGPIRWWAHLNSIGEPPSDKITHQVAQLIQVDGEQRDRFTQGIYIPTREGEALARQEAAFKAVKKAETVEKKIAKAVKEKKIVRQKKISALVEEAAKAGVIGEAEVVLLKKAEALRLDAITVDDFSQEEYLGKASVPAARKTA